MGPNLTENLLDMLVKFHLKSYAMVADISKVFLRIGLKENKIQVTKIVIWMYAGLNPSSLAHVQVHFCYT